MPDTKISALTDGTTAEASDRLAVARDPTGTPLQRYVTPAYIKDYILGLANTWTAAQTFSAGITMSGNQSSAAWTTNGLRFKGVAGTLTDTSSSGTVADGRTNVLGGDTIAASSSTTFTDYYSHYITQPTAGTNVTFTRRWALGLGGALSLTDYAHSAGSSAYNVPAWRVGSITNPTGMGVSGTVTGTLIANSVGVMSFHSTNGLLVKSSLPFAWGNAEVNGAGDTFLYRDAANTIAQRNGTNAQVRNHYDTYASSTDYHRLAMKTARATLASVSGASVTATGLIPDGAVVVGVTSKVTVSLGTGSGTTGYQIGDGSDVDRWGAVTGTASGTTSDNRDWTAGTVQAFTGATDVVVTATGGNFNGTGTIYLSVQYLIGECD